MCHSLVANGLFSCDIHYTSCRFLPPPLYSPTEPSLNRNKISFPFKSIPKFVNIDLPCHIPTSFFFSCNAFSNSFITFTKHRSTPGIFRTQSPIRILCVCPILGITSGVGVGRQGKQGRTVSGGGERGCRCYVYTRRQATAFSV